ncbi:MAG: DUF3800 domain-containing protein [Thermoleophilaceae bacterium]
MSWRIYIDEAGDRGVSEQSSAHFVASAVAVRDSDDARARAELDRLRDSLGRQPGQVLHFQRFSHSQRLKAVQDLTASSIAAIFNVVLCKRGFSEPAPGDVSYIVNPDPMYLWAVRLLLERVSWFVRDQGDGPAITTFAHVRRFKVQKLHDYRRALERDGAGVHWPAFAGHPFRTGTPDKVRLLQFADTAASALFRAVEPDAYGNQERRYLDELRPKLYRRGAGPLTSYGLKVFPSKECESGGSLEWLREL